MPETIQHLIFFCSYSSYIWTLCKLKLKLPPQHDTLQQEAAAIKGKFSMKTKTYILLRLVLPVAVPTLVARKKQEGLSAGRYAQDYVVQQALWGHHAVTTNLSNSSPEQEILINWSWSIWCTFVFCLFCYLIHLTYHPSLLWCKQYGLHQSTKKWIISKEKKIKLNK